MRLQPFRSLVSWLCLLALGLDWTLHALGPVLCICPGGTRIEWVCEKDNAGACLECEDHAGDVLAHRDDERHPCEDMPLCESHEDATPVFVQNHGGGLENLVKPLVQVLCIPAWTADRPSLLGRVVRECSGRPPDTIAHLRTIVMRT